MIAALVHALRAKSPVTPFDVFGIVVLVIAALVSLCSLAWHAGMKRMQRDLQ